MGNFTEWQPIHSKTFFAESIKRIKVVGEDRFHGDSLKETREKIRSHITQANNIYFLGYGFDSMNNQILMHGQHSGWWKDKTIHSTSVGITPKQASEINSELFGTNLFKINGSSVAEYECLSLLRDHSSFGTPEKVARGGNIP